MKGEVKALTAEGRASALMLVIMVPGPRPRDDGDEPARTWSRCSRPSTGQILLGVCAVMIGGGYLWMNSMVKIDV